MSATEAPLHKDASCTVSIRMLSQRGLEWIGVPVITLHQRYEQTPP